MSNSSVREFVRFLVGGFFNTAFSYAIYLAILPVTDPFVAYTSAFVCGILSGYAINTFFVFRSQWSWKRLCAFPLVHAVNYVLGAAILWLAIGPLGVDKRLAPLLSIAMTIPVNFLLTKLIIKRRAISSS